MLIEVGIPMVSSNQMLRARCTKPGQGVLIRGATLSVAAAIVVACSASNRLRIIGDPCEKYDECQSGRCDEQMCKAANPSAQGARCRHPLECRSEVCIATVEGTRCGAGVRPQGAACTRDEQCAGGTCSGEVCGSLSDGGNGEASGAQDGGPANGGAVDAGLGGTYWAGSRVCGDGICWVLPEAPAASIVDLHVTAEGQVWAATSAGHALRWEGDRWLPYPVPGVQFLTTLWEHGTLHGMGKNGNWASWNGSKWEARTPALAKTIGAACATGTGEVWAGGHSGLSRLIAGAWVTDENVSVRDLLCIGAKVWRLTDSGVELFDGTGWNPVFAVSSGYRLEGTGVTDLWVTRTSGVVHWDGNAARTEDPSGRLIDIAVSALGARWVVGERGFAARWSGTSWEVVPLGVGRDLKAVVVLGPDDVWIGGDAGVLVHWDGLGSQVVNPAALYNYRDGWSSSADDIWLVGTRSDGSGLTHHWDGVRWNDVPNPAAGTLTDIWGFGPDDVWAGNTDHLIHWNGATWLGVDLGEPPDVRGLWGPTSNDLWIRRSHDVVRWDGTQLGNPEVQLGSGCPGIWGTSASDVWTSSGVEVSAVYAGMKRYDGSGWHSHSFRPTARTGCLRDMQVFSSNNIWCVTSYGSVGNWTGAEWISSGFGAPGGTSAGVRGKAIGGPRPDLLVTVGSLAGVGSVSLYDGIAKTKLPVANLGWNEVVPVAHGALVLGDGAVLWVE